MDSPHKGEPNYWMVLLADLQGINFKLSRGGGHTAQCQKWESSWFWNKSEVINQWLVQVLAINVPESACPQMNTEMSKEGKDSLRVLIQIQTNGAVSFTAKSQRNP